MMSDASCAIFVAVNDNHRAWYEMLIPFVLSLRATDFGGRLVVLGYGLSDEKVAVLHRHGIEVAVAAAETSLPLGRYIEVARYCAAHPEISKAALYDADIWFCSPRHDLFALIDRDTLYASPDPLFCQFVINPLTGPRQPELWQMVVRDVLDRYGYALQAGLVAGTTGAWAEFARHVATCRAAIGTDFHDCFGLDTTLLHLWAARNDLGLLPNTQNFITRWGVAEVMENDAMHFAAGPGGGPIRALHMSGNVRFFDRWRYYANHPAAALEGGAAFALSGGGVVPAVEAGTGWDDIQALSAGYGLRVHSLRKEDDPGASLSVLSSSLGLNILCEGNIEITFEATRDILSLNIYMSHPSGFPSPIRCSVSCRGQETPSHSDLMTHYCYSLNQGTQFTLSSTSLPGQLCKGFWYLSDRRDIQQ
jgi:hypothetical protein